MSLMIIKELNKDYGPTVVLKNLSFRIEDNDRAGLVGPNGCGKTTLLRLLAGAETPTSGSIQASAGVRVGYLPQDPPDMGDATLWDAMLDTFADLIEAQKQIHELAAQLQGHGDDARLQRYGELHADFENRGGYTYIRRIETVLSGLGFTPEQYQMPMSRLSGGQRTRALLAKTLLLEPDLLMLDEPTNHLDLEAVEWLEHWLSEYRGGLIIVSHDRYFLDRTTNMTLELTLGDIESYRGPYSTYVTLRAERYLERTRRWEQQQKHIEETQEFIRRFLAGQRSQEAKGRRTRLERFMRDEAIPKPVENQSIRVRLTPNGRTGDIALNTEDLAVGYQPGKPIVQPGRLQVERGRRVAIVGGNGCGKTTLLRTMLGKLAPLSGKIRLGSGSIIGYLSQTHEDLQAGATVLQALQQVDPGMQQERARSILGSFLFIGDDIYKTVASLSGGQRSRLVLARLAVQGANVLMLDEPTNHLDIPSQEILQDVLAEFPGTIFIVSHDRYLIQAIATDIWAIDGGELTILRGRWDDYLKWREDRAMRRAAAGRQEEPTEARQQWIDRKEAHRDQRKRQNELKRLNKRQEELEAEIHKLEAELAKMSDAITQAGQKGDLNRIGELGSEYEKQDTKLKELWRQWEQIVLDIESE